MQHFSHPHQLYDASNMLSQSQNLACFGCKLPLFGTCYACSPCNFYLHKFCFELPQSANFVDSHPKHTLGLLYPPYGRGPCDACGESCIGFTYNCTLCNYNVHANCATLLHSHHEPRNDRDLYMSTFIRQKVSEYKTMRSELDAGVKVERNYEEEKARIVKMQKEEELRRMRQNLEMQRMKNTYDSMDFFNSM